MRGAWSHLRLHGKKRVDYPRGHPKCTCTQSAIPTADRAPLARRRFMGPLLPRHVPFAYTKAHTIETSSACCDVAPQLVMCHTFRESARFRLFISASPAVEVGPPLFTTRPQALATRSSYDKRVTKILPASYEKPWPRRSTSSSPLCFCYLY